jgi:Uma2 family endonuclease
VEGEWVLMVQTYYTTLEEFLQFISLPENDDRLFEYIEGEIVEVVTNNYCSLVAARILGRIITYVESRGLGYVTGEAGGYQVGDHRFMPDVGFISKQRQPKASHETFNSNPPDLAVEVLSPTDKPRKVQTKLEAYEAAGTVVWLVDPEKQEIDVRVPGQPKTKLRLDDTLDGGDVLPGFSLVVKDIFGD